MAILKLKTPLNLNKSVAKIRLPDKDVESSGLTVIPSGWNPTLSNRTVILSSLLTESEKLRTFHTEIITTDECIKIVEIPVNLDDESSKNLDPETRICTRLLSAEASACSVSLNYFLLIFIKNRFSLTTF